MDHNDTCLVHQAVLHNNLSKLTKLVEEDKNRLSCRNSLGQTPLLTSIIKNRSKNIILYLIEAGSDVNAVDCWNRNSLHTAIEHRLEHDFVVELLKKDIDVNAQDLNGRTPMHHAVLNGVDTLSMLLYYNADVTVESTEGYTALGNALGWCNFDAVEMLVDYYSHDDLSEIINDYFYTGNNWLNLQFILELDSSKLFKIVWSVIDTKYLLQSLPSFIIVYLNRCRFPKHEWIEALLLILESDVASSLVRVVNKHNFQPLFVSLYDKNIDLNNRVMLISTFLSLGAKVYHKDVRDVLNIYGCGQEFECLVYGASCRKLNLIRHPLGYYLVNLRDDYTSNRLSKLFREQIRSVLCVGSSALQKSVITNLGYFSIPLYVRNGLLDECEIALFSRDKVRERLSTLPEFPTLLELSRNQVRNHIVDSYKVKYPYRVFDIVKRLNIPQVVKDIILFRSAIY